MSSNYSSSRREPRSSNSGRRRSPSGPRKSFTPATPAKAPKLSFFGKLLSLVGLGGKKTSHAKHAVKTERPERRSTSSKERSSEKTRITRKPERVEVTSPRLYIGNLSFDATESDLFELFSGVGQVQNVELVANRDTHRSKGFGFIQMTTLEEAKRAVEELHDKEYMNRKLVVSGAKALPEMRSDSRSEARAEARAERAAEESCHTKEDHCCQTAPAEETPAHEGNCCHTTPEKEVSPHEGTCCQH